MGGEDKGGGASFLALSPAALFKILTFFFFSWQKPAASRWQVQVRSYRGGSSALSTFDLPPGWFADEEAGSLPLNPMRFRADLLLNMLQACTKEPRIEIIHLSPLCFTEFLVPWTTSNPESPPVPTNVASDGGRQQEKCGKGAVEWLCFYSPITPRMGVGVGVGGQMSAGVLLESRERRRERQCTNLRGRQIIVRSVSHSPSCPHRTAHRHRQTSVCVTVVDTRTANFGRSFLFVSKVMLENFNFARRGALAELKAAVLLPNNTRRRVFFINLLVIFSPRHDTLLCGWHIPL